MAWPAPGAFWFGFISCFFWRDALMKRAELKLTMSKGSNRYESLAAAVKRSPVNAKAFCWLGECYDLRGEEEDER